MEVISLSGIPDPPGTDGLVVSSEDAEKFAQLVSAAGALRARLGRPVLQRARLDEGRFIIDPDGEWTICTTGYYDPDTGTLTDPGANTPGADD